MTTPRPEDFARHFPQNGMKLLCQEGLNVRDLLTINRSAFSGDIDYPRLTVDPTNYVQRDYRSVESDLVLRAPLRQRGRRPRLTLWIYLLLEHQTEPDTFMPLRLLEYDVAIYKAQVRDWLQTHASVAGLQLMPVLPLVLYTGVRPWPSVGQVADLLAGGGRFATLAPTLTPAFVSLRDTPAADLEAGGAFGQVLRLVQARREPSANFRALLEQVVRALEKLTATQLPRWQTLMSYLHALLYHERDPQEHAELQERIEHAVRTERHRREVSVMGKTIADMFREQGQLQGQIKTLLRQLRLRFGDLPEETVALIEACKEESQLDSWLDAFVNARSLAQVGIRTPQ